MANMGLVLKKIAPTNGSGLSVRELNVLPVVYQPEPISLTRVLALPGAVIAISLLLFLALMTQSATADIDEMRGQMESATRLLQQKINQRQQSLGAILEIEQKLNETETLHGNMAAAVSNLEKQSREVNGDLEVTVNSRPETVHLTNISHSGDAITFKGWAESEAEFLSYLRALETSERFPGITITSIRQAADRSVDFNVVLSVGD
jgi:Tfp pilus assembly protein PilN